ncbi:hypothetical protein D3C76_675210 [compost metagenome]
MARGISADRLSNSADRSSSPKPSVNSRLSRLGAWANAPARRACSSGANRSLMPVVNGPVVVVY